MNKRLSEKAYWESLYKGSDSNKKRWWHKFFQQAQTPWSCLVDYTDYHLWRHVLPNFLVNGEKGKAIEIGSAPGNNLLKVRTFGYEPYGVEYSAAGVIANKNNFAAHGIDPDNVIEADFFSENFQREYKNCFDLVMSFGFLEHFDDPVSVVEAHLSLLKPNGLLVVTIPNFSGLNKEFVDFFDPEILSIHNTAIMNLEKFRQTFENQCLESLYCRYLGRFHFGLFVAKNKWRRIMLNICKCLQLFLNLVYFCSNSKRNTSHFLSPHLIFIGRKNTA